MMRDIRDGMRALSLVEGRDYIFEGWWADSDSSRFPGLADALLVRRPAAVLVGTVIAAKVLQERSRTVPIVMTGVNDPVAVGRVSPGPAATSPACQTWREISSSRWWRSHGMPCRACVRLLQ
jgi:ABC-type uncharacterized transport system substrate-binding protein